MKKYERPEWARKFYSGQKWKRCRASFISYKGGLCENCLAMGQIVPGTEVHHIVHMNAETVKDSRLAYGYDNLKLLCRKCHAEEHRNKRRWILDDDGVLREVSPPFSE